MAGDEKGKIISFAGPATAGYGDFLTVFCEDGDCERYCGKCEYWSRVAQKIKNEVDHPEHYGGADNPYEAIKVIEAWSLGFCLGNTVKYISRAGKKHPDILTDLKKAAWYLQREIQKLERSS